MADTRDEAVFAREQALIGEIEKLLPEFAQKCRESADMLVLHQDAFAADYQDEEYSLFGKAMKFAGLHGKEVRIIGKNRETLTTMKATLVQ